MQAELFYQLLKKNGFGPFVGVPCSVLVPFLEILDRNREALIVTSEGEAMGVASGLYLAGKKPVVFMQNSGLCNALNPLISLNLIYKIPILLLITLRGKPSNKDAVQHKIMGKKTEDFLDILSIDYRYLSEDIDEFIKNLRCLEIKLKKSLKPVAFLLRRGIFKTEIPENKITQMNTIALTRQEAVNAIAKSLSNNNCFVITTTGKITREYYYCYDKTKNNFYMTGSMGCASALGLGVAMCIGNDKKVVVIDGDGAVLMKMGNLATIGNIKPKNLIHIVLDNQCHESTGGQMTSSITTALDKVAKNCGYSNTYKITKRKEVKQVMRKSLNIAGPTFILIKISNMGEGGEELGRVKESPEQIKKQFMQKIKY